MTASLDLIVRAGRVATPNGIQQLDIGVAEGKIVLLAQTISAPAAQQLSAEGLYILPGIIDAHVHFNEPGRTDWEGLASGSRALAAGGGTLFFDMPLNSDPPVVDVETFECKRRLGEEKSALDFAIWGGLVPANLDQLEALRDAGAIGLKAFMCDSGIDEFPGITDRRTLYSGMQRAAQLGLLVAVHAEDEALANEYAARASRLGARDVHAWLESRPVEVETRAIKTALDIAGETGCALHIVHVSSSEGIDLITQAKKTGVNVTAETCPHYLILNAEDVVRLGAVAKCCPPLRSELNRQSLWKKMLNGEVDTIGSDHSPAPPEMKQSTDFFSIWGGISGCQHGFPLLLGRVYEHLGGTEGVIKIMPRLSSKVASRFRLGPQKGRLTVGADADFALWDFRENVTLANTDLYYRHRQGPYSNQVGRARVVQTYSRGQRVFGGAHASGRKFPAQLIRPQF